MFVIGTVVDQILLVPIMICLVILPLFIVAAAGNAADKGRSDEGPIYIALMALALVGAGAMAYLARHQYSAILIIIYSFVVIVSGLWKQCFPCRSNP